MSTPYSGTQWVNGGTVVTFYGPQFCSTTGSSSKLCPDLLTIDAIGAADNLRGRVVRAFFTVMRLWPA